MAGRWKLILASGVLFGLVLGVFVTGIAFSLAAERLVLTEMQSPFDDVDKTVKTITNRIENAPGWRVLDVMDYDQVLRTGGQKSIGKMTLIKFCSARHAYDMLSADDTKQMAAMLPKTLAVYEKSDGHVYVATGNGAVMGKMLRGRAAGIAEVVSLEVEDILRFMNFRFTFF